MSADRLVATVLLLQRRERVTAAELATALEISVATARRDLAALSAAGVPVYPQPGRGGGWQLVGGARTDLTGLTARESEALFLLLGPAATGRPEARSALAKLVRALPATFRDEAEAASQAVLVDPQRWGSQVADLPAAVGVLQSAVVRRRSLEIDYTPARGNPRRRMVDPYGLVDKDGVWYLLAGTDAGRRTFRVNRIGDVSETGQIFQRPDGLDLDADWRASATAVEAARSEVAARVSAPRRLVPVLRAQFGQHLMVLPDPGLPDREPGGLGSGDGDGALVTLEVRAHLVRGLAEQLAGWGRQVEVLDPPELRTELARIGAELVQSYGS